MEECYSGSVFIVLLLLTSTFIHSNGDWRDSEKHCQCGVLQVDEAGEVASHPWLVNVTLLDEQFLCSGIVLASNLVLISRTCFKNKKIADQITDIRAIGEVGNKSDGFKGVKIHRRKQCSRLVALEVKTRYKGNYDYTSTEIYFRPVCLPLPDELLGPSLVGTKVRYQTSMSRVNDLVVKRKTDCDPEGRARLLHQGLRKDVYCFTIKDRSLDVEAGQPLFVDVQKNPFSNLGFGDSFGFNTYMVGVTAYVWRDAGKTHVFFVSTHSIMEDIEFYVGEAKATPCSQPYKWEKTDMTIPRDESLDCECGIPRSGLTPRIIGGAEAVKYEFPWLTRLTIQEWSEDEDTGEVSKVRDDRCGGAIINDRMILTAAHCVFHADWIKDKTLRYEDLFDETQQIYVAFNAHTSDTTKDPAIVTQETVEVEDVRYMSGLVDGWRRKYTLPEMDLGLLILKTPLDFTKKDAQGRPFFTPICLPKLGDKIEVVGKEATVAGWGNTVKTSDKMVFPEVLQTTKVTIQPLSECYKNFKNYSVDGFGKTRLYIYRGLICGGIDWNKNIGEGDSGGPDIIERSPGKFWQIGINSYSDAFQDDSGNTIGKAYLYSDVQEPMYLRWVEYYSQKHGGRYCKK